MNGHWLLKCCLVIAITLKAALCYHFFQFETDKSSQAIAAMNLVHGNGLTIGKTNVSDLSIVHYKPIVGWPPGYSLLTAISFTITRNLKSAALIADLVGVILFMLAMYLVLRKLNFSPSLTCILLLFNGALLTDNIYLSTPSDLICVAFILFALAGTITLFETTVRNNRLVILLTVINFLPALFRFMYIPVVFFIPLFILWNGWYSKDRVRMYQGVLSLSLTVVYVAILLAYQVATTGMATYSVMDTGTGRVEWKNVLAMHPFLFASFMNLNFVILLLNSLTGILYEHLQNAFRIINLLLLPVLLFYLSAYMVKKKGVPRSRWELFFLSSAGVAMITFLVVVYASLTTEGRLGYPYNRNWTFVNEGRYFLTFMALLPVYTGYILFENKSGGIVKSAVRVAFACLLLLEVLHSGYFIAKEFRPGYHAQGNLYLKDSMEDFISNTINKQQSAGLDVVFASDHGTFCNYAVMKGAKALYDPRQLTGEAIHSSKNTVLYLIMTEKMIPDYQTFINKEGVSFITKVDMFVVYELKLPINK